MKWIVYKIPSMHAWRAFEIGCGGGVACRCRYFDTWRGAFWYAEWHATGRMEPTS